MKHGTKLFLLFILLVFLGFKIVPPILHAVFSFMWFCMVLGFCVVLAVIIILIIVIRRKLRKNDDD